MKNYLNQDFTKIRNNEKLDPGLSQVFVIVKDLLLVMYQKLIKVLLVIQLN